MKKVGDYIVYRKSVCKVLEVKKNHINQKDYYLLQAVDDDSLKLDVPVDNERGFLRELITKKEIDKLISQMKDIDLIHSNDRTLENEYRMLLNSGKHEDLIRIIKTAYLRNHERVLQKKKIGDKDQHYFELAEKYSYQEFSIVLGKSFDETKNYVIDCVENG